MEQALAKVKAMLGKDYPLVIGDEEIRTEDTLKSINPIPAGRSGRIVFECSPELATKAIETAVKKFEEWKWVDPAKRSKYLFKAANLMRQRKHEFSAVMIYEVGKTWPEADADTAEAIDFLEFYARENSALFCQTTYYKNFR